ENAEMCVVRRVASRMQVPFGGALPPCRIQGAVVPEVVVADPEEDRICVLPLEDVHRLFEKDNSVASRIRVQESLLEELRPSQPWENDADRDGAHEEDRRQSAHASGNREEEGTTEHPTDEGRTGKGQKKTDSQVCRISQ